jgi:hypothetical protein
MRNLFGDLKVDFHAMCKIMDCPLNLMIIYLKTLRLFMTYYDFLHYDITF